MRGGGTSGSSARPALRGTIPDRARHSARRRLIVFAGAGAVAAILIDGRSKSSSRVSLARQAPSSALFVLAAMLGI